MAVLHEADEMSEGEEESPGLHLSPSGSHEPLRLSLSDDGSPGPGRGESKLPLSFSDDEDGGQGRVPLSFSEDDDDDMQRMQLQLQSPGDEEGDSDCGRRRHAGVPSRPKHPRGVHGSRTGVGGEYGGLCVEVSGAGGERFDSLTPESGDGSLTPEDPAFAKTLRR